MRIIKFRGYNSQNKEWLYGSLLKCSDSYLINPEDSDRIAVDDLIVDTESVGQFTGLHDKNGKEIYEGDIICSEKYKHIHVISYDDTLGSFVGKTPGDRYGTFTGPINQRWINDYEKEVIGNIHDNPEMMKGGVE